MTTTETPITLTGHDRHRLLDDLWAVPGLGEHLASIEINARSRSSAQVFSTDEAIEASALQVAASTLDDPTFAIHSYADYDALYVNGLYRGVPLRVYAGFSEPAMRAVLAAAEPGKALELLAQAATR